MTCPRCALPCRTWLRYGLDAASCARVGVRSAPRHVRCERRRERSRAQRSAISQLLGRAPPAVTSGVAQDARPPYEVSRRSVTASRVCMPPAPRGVFLREVGGTNAPRDPRARTAAPRIHAASRRCACCGWRTHRTRAVLSVPHLPAVQLVALTSGRTYLRASGGVVNLYRLMNHGFKQQLSLAANQGITK